MAAADSTGPGPSPVSLRLEDRLEGERLSDSSLLAADELVSKICLDAIVTMIDYLRRKYADPSEVKRVKIEVAQDKVGPLIEEQIRKVNLSLNLAINPGLIIRRAAGFGFSVKDGALSVRVGENDVCVLLKRALARTRMQEVIASGGVRQMRLEGPEEDASWSLPDIPKHRVRLRNPKDEGFAYALRDVIQGTRKTAVIRIEESTLSDRVRGILSAQGYASSGIRSPKENGSDGREEPDGASYELFLNREQMPPNVAEKLKKTN